MISDSEHYDGFKAHNLGFLAGREAAQAGGQRELKWSRPLHGHFTDREWAEYRRGWDEALDAHDTDNA